jgi:hypothetical protein
VSNDVAAKRTTGFQKKQALERQIAALTECRDIVSDLERSGTKPDTDPYQPNELTVNIEGIKEQLSELQTDAAPVARKIP